MEQNRNQTPRANRVHIGFFGRRNAGKSSLINAVAGQTISVVSPVCGTTTDTVEKAMELLPIGAVVLIRHPRSGRHRHTGRTAGTAGKAGIFSHRSGCAGNRCLHRHD